MHPIISYSLYERHADMTLAMCGISKLALRPHGEPIWAYGNSDPQLHEAPLIRNRTTFVASRQVAIYNILSCLQPIYF